MKFRRVLWTLFLISAVSLSSLCSAAALKVGDRGDKVSEIQNYLIAQNLLHAEADGVYGSSTVQAIKDFQAALGLEADGICGEETYKILRAAAYDQIDVTNFKLGDYVPEPEEYNVDVPEVGANVAPILSAIETVGTVAQYAGVGDVIKLGMKGEGVIYLQNKLIDLGFYNGAADGVCGDSTIDALKDFQNSRGMKADGICGKGTYTALESDEPAVTNEYTNTNGYESSSDIPDFSRSIRVEATAYSSAEAGLSAYTALGTICRRGVIATDPNVIPLGTRVFIPGYGYAIAEDTGGAIVGHKIDVAFDTVAECYEFGRQFIEIYIVD